MVGPRQLGQVALAVAPSAAALEAAGMLRREIDTRQIQAAVPKPRPKRWTSFLAIFAEKELGWNEDIRVMIFTRLLTAGNPLRRLGGDAIDSEGIGSAKSF